MPSPALGTQGTTGKAAEQIHTWGALWEAWWAGSRETRGNGQLWAEKAWLEPGRQGNSDLGSQTRGT